MRHTSPLPASELVLNPDGSVYHLALHPEQVGDIIFTAGDPDRVAHISRHFDRIDHRVQKREFVTHTGELNGRRVTALSTGIGTDNIDIVLNELDALVNIDLTTRTIREQLKSLQIIRLGTSGGLQPELGVDSFVVSTHGIGLDNLMHYYVMDWNEEERGIQEALTAHLGFGEQPVRPYVAQGSSLLLEKLAPHFAAGMTVTCSGFYGPQGRQLRGTPRYADLLDKLPQFEYAGHRITNFEMETSGIYGLGRMLGHECLSVNTIIANRVLQQFSGDPHGAVDRMIARVLELATA